MLVGMLAGVLCDRFGHKRLALAGLAVLAAGRPAGRRGIGIRQPAARRAFSRASASSLFVVSAVALMNAAAAQRRATAPRRSGCGAPTCRPAARIALLAAPLADRRAGAGAASGWCLPLARGGAAAIALARFVAAVELRRRSSSMRLVAESLAAAAATSPWRCCSPSTSRSGPRSWSGCRPSWSTSTAVGRRGGARHRARTCSINVAGQPARRLAARARRAARHAGRRRRGDRRAVRDRHARPRRCRRRRATSLVLAFSFSAGVIPGVGVLRTAGARQDPAAHRHRQRHRHAGLADRPVPRRRSRSPGSPRSLAAGTRPCGRCSRSPPARAACGVAIGAIET